MSVFYDDLDTFFRARRLRQGLDGWLEDSYDYGLYWKGEHDSNHRLTWIGATHREKGDGGELYLVRLQGGGFKALTPSLTMLSAGMDSGDVQLLCVIPPVPVADPESIFDRRIGGDNDPAANVEAILDGWAEICGLPNSIDWLRDRASEAIQAGWATAS